jgi:hypothetical protein
MAYRGISLRLRGDKHMKIKFRDKKHIELYQEWTARARCGNDPEYCALFYLISLDAVAREHINDLFDFKEHRIKRDGALEHPWITSTSAATVRLAFNLFNFANHTDRDENGEPLPNSADKYTPCLIFCQGREYARYYVEALQMRLEDNFMD